MIQWFNLNRLNKVTISLDNPSLLAPHVPPEPPLPGPSPWSNRPYHGHVLARLQPHLHHLLVLFVLFLRCRKDLSLFTQKVLIYFAFTFYNLGNISMTENMVSTSLVKQRYQNEILRTTFPFHVTQVLFCKLCDYNTTKGPNVSQLAYGFQPNGKA